MKRIKVIRKVKTKQDIIDVNGWTIPEGTVLHITKEGKLPPHPKGAIKGDLALVVRVDNGTGFTALMPETALVVTAEQDIEEAA